MTYLKLVSVPHAPIEGWTSISYSNSIHQTEVNRESKASEANDEEKDLVSY